MPKYTLKVDGSNRTVQAEADEPLLYALTDGLKLKGPRFGCGLAQCGTCTVLDLTGTLNTALPNANNVVGVYDGTQRLGTATANGTGWTFTTPTLSLGSRSLTARVEDVTSHAAISAAPAAFVANETGLALTTMTDNQGTVQGDNVAFGAPVQYILLKQTGATTDTLFVNEVEVYAGGTNVALSKTVTASSYTTWTNAQGGYPASGVTNGNLAREGGNGYASNQATTDNWLMVNLGQAYVVDTIKLYALSSSGVNYTGDLQNIRNVDVFGSTQSISALTYTQLKAGTNGAVRMGGTGASPAYTTTIITGATTDDGTPTIKGTLLAALATGEQVSVYDNSSLLGQATVTGLNWSFTPPSDLPYTTHNFAAKVEKSDGTALIATSARAMTTIPSVSGITATANASISRTVASGESTDDTVLDLTGTLTAPLANPAGDVVKVFDGTALLGTATVTGTGWTFTTPSLATGSHSLTARIENAGTHFIGDNSAPFVVNETGISLSALTDDYGTLQGDSVVSAGVTARYILLKQTGAIATSMYVNEVEVHVGGVNVAAGKTVSVGNASVATGFTANKVVDGVLTRDGFASNVATTDNWLMVDLGQNYALDDVKLYALSSTGTYGAGDMLNFRYIDVFASTQSISGLTYAQLATGNSGAIRLGGTGASGTISSTTLLATGSSDDRTPTVKGTLTAALLTGETVAVYDDTNLLGSATVTGLNWTFTPATALIAGTHHFTASVLNASGTELMRSTQLTDVVL